jgi:formylmethanofuran dehydrogenase subunit A
LSNNTNIIVDDIQKLIDENNIIHYTIKLGKIVRKNGSVSQKNMKTISWINPDDTIPLEDEENKIIYLDYNDPKAFQKTNRTPDQIKQIVQNYLNKPQ